MFDYQHNFNDPTQQIGSEEDFQKVLSQCDAETWCRETQRCKELEHGALVQLEQLKKGDTGTGPCHLFGDGADLQQEMARLEELAAQYHKEAALAKSHLPKFMWQATFPNHRRKKEEAVANGLFILDWDGIWDRTPDDALQEVLTRYENEGKDFIRDERVMLIHRTPSQH